MRWMRLYAHFAFGRFGSLAVATDERQSYFVGDRTFLIEIPDFVRYAHNQTTNEIKLAWGKDKETEEARIVSVTDASSPKSDTFRIMLRYANRHYAIESVQANMQAVVEPIKQNPELAKAMGLTFLTPFWMLK